MTVGSGVSVGWLLSVSSDSDAETGVEVGLVVELLVPELEPEPDSDSEPLLPLPLPELLDPVPVVPVEIEVGAAPDTQHFICDGPGHKFETQCPPFLEQLK